MFKFLKPKKQKQLGNFLIAPQPGISLGASIIADNRLPENLREPVLISFGTRDGHYDTCAERLEANCREVGQQCSIETIPACSRANACLYKPTFIKFKLLMLGRPVLWLDVDSQLTGKIELPGGNWDIATLRNQRHKLNDYSSQVILFNPTVTALRFLELWEQFCSSPWLEGGLDHRRFNYARHVLDGGFAEVDLSPMLEGKLVGDAGTKKEQTF
ncbi:MAG: hypothetical protein KDJ29_03345 [Hyphomicrobiales bacterium]|nr:hypothetical protein [Hyphomicrobiales bacterium]